jgi:dihydrolipoamide dehydrogenase
VSHQGDKFTVSYTGMQQEESVAEGDALLVATGMRAWSDDIGIENTSIMLDAKGFIKVDQFLKTAAEDTWAFGDCIGHALFRHMANFEGDYLKEQLLGGDCRPIEYPPVPFAIFTHPQIGVVGKSEEKLSMEGFDIVAGIAEYKNSDMGLARRSDAGLVKLLFDAKSRRLLSAHVVGDEAATMIHIAIAYIQKKATIEDITSTVFIHPALPEVLSSAAFNARNKL